MTGENKVLARWISLSVFYTESYWKQFIAEFLKPYLLEQRKNLKIRSVYISFSEDQGDHILLAIECIAADHLAIAGQLRERLTAYLELNPSEDKIPAYKGTHFFMNFPNNTIQEEFSDPVFMKYVLEFHLFLSERIISVFAEEEMDDSSILSFILSVTMIFCSSWEKLNPGMLTGRLSGLLETELKKDDHLFDVYHSLFNENRSMITEMYAECSSSITPADMVLLKESYSGYLSKNGGTDSSNNTFCMPLDQTIVRQLNKDPGLLRYVYYLVYLGITAEKEQVNLS